MRLDGQPVGNTEPIQIDFVSLTGLRQGYMRSSYKQQHRRMVQNNIWNQARIPFLLRPLQHFSRTNND